MPLRKNKDSGLDASRRSKAEYKWLVSALGGITTHSTRAESAWMSFARLKLALNLSRRVNSSVRHASRKQENQFLSDAAQKTNTELNDILDGRSNNSFDAGGISLPLIENLNGCADASRRVNSGVRCYNLR